MDGSVNGRGGPALWMAAEDVRRLIVLHESEPAADLLESLRRRTLRRSFAVTPDRDDAIQAMALIDEVLDDLPESPDAAALESLAADYAAIHRTGLYRASPVESDWVASDGPLDDDPAEQMLRWRETAGLPADPVRPADHLVSELRVLAALLQRGDGEAAVRFLDSHLLRWVPAFCGRIATRCREPFYVGVAILTNAYLDHLRDRLAEACALPRSAIEPAPESRRRRWAQDPRPRACMYDA